MSQRSIIYIALTEEDIALAISKVGEGDVIISDLSCPVHLGKTVAPFISIEEEAVLANSVRHWFHEVINMNRYPEDIYGYVNNFYECTVRPLVTYFRAIDLVIKTVKNNDVIFVLPRKMIWSKKTSTYYMAEHESAGVYLYDRVSVFIPYLKEYLRSLNVSIQQGVIKLPLKQSLMNMARVWGALCVRFIKDLKNNLIRFNKKINITSKPDFIFLVRTNGQSSTLLPFLKNTSLNVGVLVVDSNTGSNVVEFLTRNIQKKKNVQIIFRKSVKFGLLFKSYITTFFNLLKWRNIRFNYSGIEFNFNQAFAEVIVMSANLRVYKYQVKGSLDDVFRKSNKILKMLLSMEQKSPHAYIDSIIADNLLIPSVQIKQCNQSYSQLPEPVFSNNFLCDTPEVLRKFQTAWPDKLNKLNYIGTFQGIKDTHTFIKNTRGGGEIKKICFFSGVHQQVNIRAIGLVQKLNEQKVRIELTVKLHPRDSNIYASIFPGIKIIETQAQSFSDFCCYYNAAVTYPSGVVGELIFNNLPFIVYKPDHKDYRDTDNIFTPAGIKIVSTDDDLLSALGNIEKLTDEFSVFQQNFLHKAGVIIDIKKIDENIKILEKAMRGAQY